MSNNINNNNKNQDLEEQGGDFDGVISMPKPLAAMKTISRFSIMSGGDFLPSDLLSRSCSAPPTSDNILPPSSEPSRTHNSFLYTATSSTTNLTDTLKLFEGMDLTDNETLADPNYAAFFHSHSRLDPRLPPPIYRPGQSWQQQQNNWTSMTGLGSSAPGGTRLTSRFVRLVEEGDHDSFEDKHRKKLVDMIQEDFPRTPSPVYAIRAASEIAPEPKKATNKINWNAYANVPSFVPSSDQLKQPSPVTNNNYEQFEDITTDHALSSHAAYLLEEVRKRKVDLHEVAGMVLEFSMDQHGSRYIQQKLEAANEPEKALLFFELLPHALNLMTDVFGNYVIQKFFEFGSDDQRILMARAMQGHVVTLALQMYGCRVVQKALEHVPLRHQTVLVAELEGHVLRCVRDQNGNHVIQKCIECVDPTSMPFLAESFRGQVYSLATHPYGCRVIQRIFEHGRSDVLTALLSELHQYTVALIQDQYGNYVVQHILEQGTLADRSVIIEKILGHFVDFSCHKFASNVVEKCVLFGSDSDRQCMIDRMMEQVQLSDGTSDIGLLVMMRDQFGNYVIQKMIDIVQDNQRESLLNRIRPHSASLRKFTYGKHILSKIDRLLSPCASPSKSTLSSTTTSSMSFTTASLKKISVQDPRQFPPLGQKY